MAGVGGEAWACGKPVFYNVCISLSNLSGPVIQGDPASSSGHTTTNHSGAPAPANGDFTHTESKAYNPKDSTVTQGPVLTQPMARTEKLAGSLQQQQQQQMCRCPHNAGSGMDRFQCTCGFMPVRAGRADRKGHKGHKDTLVGTDMETDAKKTVHKTVITVTGVDGPEVEPKNIVGGLKPPVAGAKSTRRYSTVVSLEACGRALCTTRAQDEVAHPSHEGTEEDTDSFLLRKVSHTSDYSFSSDSSLGSTSPAPSPRPSRDHGQDSDYFGSSSEDEGRASGDESDEDSEEDVKENLRAAMERLRVAEERSGVGLGRSGVGARPSRWRRRAHIKEYDLEQRIALEIKMREGTTKLLAACGAQGPRANQPHTLEAAKNLLTSNERMTAYMAELQRRKTTSLCQEGSQPSLSRVCLSDLRMPLIWKDSDHFKNKGDYRRFAVFVLLKIGTEIYDTVMVNPVDRSMTDICFDDIIVFNGIPPNFECNMEVYSHVLQNDLTMASTPRKLKRSLHSSISRTVGRKLAASLRDELSNGELGPKFEMVATARLGLENVSSNTATFDLTLENTENRANQLPLFGHFCCRLAAQPDCATQERIAGYAHVPESEHQKSWCRLYGWQLEVWGNKEDVHLSPHHPLSLSVDRNTEISQNGVIVTLSNTMSLDRGHLTLVLETPSEAASWLKCLQQHMADHRKWGAAAEEEMEILTPQPTRHNFILPRRGRFASLYEETPLRADGSPSSEKSSLDDLYGSSAFVNNYCTPAHITARPRALTLSSRSSFRRWGSVKYNMPFFKSKS